MNSNSDSNPVPTAHAYSGPEKNVRSILKSLGYVEVWPAGGTSWKPVDDAESYGQITDTQILRNSSEDDLAWLVDVESGETLAYARTETASSASPPPENGGESRPDDQVEFSETDLNILKEKTHYPNVRSAAYFLARTFHREVGKSYVPNQQVTTAANLAALAAWDEGLALTDLDQIQFCAYVREEIPVLELRGEDLTIPIDIVQRWFTLHEPYCGKWDISETQFTP